MSSFQKIIHGNKHFKAIRFSSLKELKEYKDVIKLGGRPYNKVSEAVQGMLGDFISPTMKEIKIVKLQDLIDLAKYAQENPNFLIGFTDLNSFMEASEQAYMTPRLEGPFENLLGMLQVATKLFMRLSGGFIVRNAIDTYNQLFSQMYMQKGLFGMITNSGRVLELMSRSNEILDIYEALSEERLLTQTAILKAKEDIQKVLKNYNLKTYNQITDKELNVIKVRCILSSD